MIESSILKIFSMVYMLVTIMGFECSTVKLPVEAEHYTFRYSYLS